jgi:hypothetical protein
MNSRRDTTRQRHRQAARPYAVAVRRWAGLGRIHHYVLALPPGPLWDRADMEAMVSQISAHPHTYWKLERGVHDGLHVHILSPFPSVAITARPDLAYCGPLTEEKGGRRGMLAYLSKPPPAELCRPGRLHSRSLDSYTRAQMYRAALHEYAAARLAALGEGRRRLRPMSGWVGRTRRQTRAQSSSFLVLAVVFYLLTLALLAAQNRVPLPGVHPTPSRPLPGRPMRLLAYSRIHPPPRSIQAQAG